MNQILLIIIGIFCLQHSYAQSNDSTAGIIDTSNKMGLAAFSKDSVATAFAKRQTYFTSMQKLLSENRSNLSNSVTFRSFNDCSEKFSTTFSTTLWKLA